MSAGDGLHPDEIATGTHGDDEPRDSRRGLIVGYSACSRRAPRSLEARALSSPFRNPLPSVFLADESIATRFVFAGRTPVNKNGL